MQNLFFFVLFLFFQPSEEVNSVILFHTQFVIHTDTAKCDRQHSDYELTGIRLLTNTGGY